MFESSFRNIAKFSARHSTGIIIFWVIALILVAPSSTLFLSNTSYDLSGSIVPADSMAQEASNLQSQYFSSTGGPGSSGQALLIVTNNTSVTTQKGAQGMMSLEHDISNYLSNINGFENITSAFTLENTTLYNFAKGVKIELNSTYGLISTLNSQITLLNGSINQTIGLIYGLPIYYLNAFSNSNGNLSYAYNQTLLLTGYNLTSVLYVNSFTQYWNSSYTTSPYPTIVMNDSVDYALHNPASPFLNAVLDNSPQTKSLMYGINANYSFLNYSNELPYYYNNTNYNSFVKNYTISTFSTQLSSNSTLSSFLNDSLNLSVDSFLNRIYALGQPATGPQIMQALIPMIYNGTEYTLKGSPLISFNPATLTGFLNAVNSSDNMSVLVSQELQQGSFSTYPIIPAPYVFHQFVGYDNSTTIIIASFSQNYSLNVVNTVTDISNNYSKTGGKLPNSSYYVAGTSALDQQLNNEILNGMVRALLIGIVLSIIIVGLFFRSPIAAFIPLAVFGFSTVLSMGLNGLLYKYVFHTTISFITPTLLLILILGLTSDYVVYIMSRYRQERRKGNPTALFDAGQWAGHAVFTSGITVALSYIVLWISNIPIFSDSGLTNAIGVVISIMLANTFLIAILEKTGTRLYWPSNITHAEKFPLEKSMTRIAGVVKNNKKKTLVVFLVVTFLASYVYFITPTSMNVFDLVPSSSGIKALEVVNNSFNGDFFDRAYIVMDLKSPVLVNGTYNLTEMKQISSLEQSLLNRSEVSQVYGPTFPYGFYVPPDFSSVPSSYTSTYKNQTNTFIGNDSHYVTIDFQLSTVSWRNQASDFITQLPAIINSSLDSSGAISQGTVQAYYIGGLTQSLNDAHSYTQSTFTKIVPILLIAIFAVLLIQLSSLFTPIRLIAMVVSSVLVALSAVFLIIYFWRNEPILIFLPLFTFITLLAVGLDYDIFMVTRVREEVLRGMSDEDATLLSIKENGGVIVTLGLLLFVTFGALYTSGIGIMQEIGLGLALGVLVDTFVSWPFFVPTIMMFLKKWNWWPSKMKTKDNNN